MSLDLLGNLIILTQKLDWMRNIEITHTFVPRNFSVHFWKSSFGVYKATKKWFVKVVNIDEVADKRGKRVS